MAQTEQTERDWGLYGDGKETREYTLAIEYTFREFAEKAAIKLAGIMTAGAHVGATDTAVVDLVAQRFGTDLLERIAHIAAMNEKYGNV